MCVYINLHADQIIVVFEYYVGKSQKTKTHVGLNARRPDFVACQQQRRRSAYACAQSDQRLCYSHIGK